MTNDLDMVKSYLEMGHHIREISKITFLRVKEHFITR